MIVNEDINTNDTSTPTQVPISGPITGPITRARQLNHQEPGRRPKGKRIRAGWIRTVEQHQLMTVTTVAYGLRLGHSSTSRNPYEVYFHMDPDSWPYLF